LKKKPGLPMKTGMSSDPTDKRTEFRSLIKIGMTIQIRASGKSAQATTINMTSAGALLRLDEPLKIAVGDKVTCDFSIARGEEALLPYWGIGSVTRVDGAIVAVHLTATGLVETRT
jgi:hypothetical protein